MRNQEGSLEQNRSKAQPNLSTVPEYQYGSPPGPASNPPEQRDGKWAGLGSLQHDTPFCNANMRR